MSQAKKDDQLIKKLQYSQLQLLKELDRVCRKLNLTYIMAFGSCLGTVRHRGFIPWDDDIDVYMRVEELEILHANADKVSEGFFLQHHGSDPEYGLMISRLRNSNTTLIEKSEEDRDINHGIFIDIYPLFNVPVNRFAFNRLVFDSMLYRLLLYGSVPHNRGTIMRIGSFVLLKILSSKRKKQILEKCYQKMKSVPHSGLLSSLYGDESRIRYREESFFPVQFLPFVDMMVPIEANYDEYLMITYGDYMKLPPIEKRVFHHNYECIDFEHSYENYRNKAYCRK